MPKTVFDGKLHYLAVLALDLVDENEFQPFPRSRQITGRLYHNWVGGVGRGIWCKKLLASDVKRCQHSANCWGAGSQIMRFSHFPLNTAESRRAMWGERPREKMKNTLKKIIWIFCLVLHNWMKNELKLWEIWHTLVVKLFAQNSRASRSMYFNFCLSASCASQCFHTLLGLKE